MKIIPLGSLPHFHGTSSKDPDYFLFEFNILCISYNYYDDAYKIKPFPPSLKDLALRLFMRLGKHTMYSLDDMKPISLNKCQDYCKSRDVNDIFRMQQTKMRACKNTLKVFFIIIINLELVVWMKQPLRQIL